MKKFLISIGLTFSGLIIGIILAELALRTLDLAPTQMLRAVDQEEFERIPGLHSPNQSFISRKNSQLPHQITINNLGYRGADFPREKPAGELRILVVGDSFTFGDLVNDSETLPHRLQLHLDQHCSGLKVINAGLAGSTIVGQSAVIARGLELDPDMVILIFHENDLIDLNAPMWNMLETNRRIKSRFPFSIVMPFLNRMALWHLARRTKARLDAWQRTPVAESYPKEDSRNFERLLQKKDEYVSRLASIKEELETRGIKLFYVTFPGSVNLEPVESNQAKVTGRVEWGGPGMVLWAENSAKSLGIPTLNLQSALLAGFKNPDDAYLWPHDGHPSAAGHKLAATTLGEFPPLLDALSSKCSR